MTEPSKHRCRRSFLKLMGYATAWTALAMAWNVMTGTVWAEEPATPATKPDLVLKHAIMSGQGLPVVASTPYLEVHFVKLCASSRRGRFRVHYRFTARAVEGAHFKLILLDRRGQVVASAIHREDVGPEKAPPTGRSFSLVGDWHRNRMSLLAVPLDAQEKTMSFSLAIRSY